MFGVYVIARILNCMEYGILPENACAISLELLSLKSVLFYNYEVRIVKQFSSSSIKEVYKLPRGQKSRCLGHWRLFELIFVLNSYSIAILCFTPRSAVMKNMCLKGVNSGKFG